MGFDIHIRTKGVMSLKRFLKTMKRESTIGDAKQSIAYFEHIDLDEFFGNMKVSVGDVGLDIMSYDRQLLKTNAEHLEYIVAVMLLKAHRLRIIDKYLGVFEYGDWRFSKESVKVTIFSESSYKGSEPVDVNFRKVADDIDEMETRFPSMEIVTKLSTS